MRYGSPSFEWSEEDTHQVSRAGSFHADLEVPVQCPGIPSFCGGADNLSNKSSSGSSGQSRATRILEVFPRSPLDLGFGSESEQPLKYKFKGSGSIPFPMWRADMEQGQLRPRKFISQKQFIEFLRVSTVFNRDQLLVDLRSLDSFFYSWLEETFQKDLNFFSAQAIFDADKEFLKSWGKAQFQGFSKTVSALCKMYPHLQIRLFFFRNNPEAIMFAQIHLALISSGRPVTQPRLPWLRDQYPLN